MERRRPARPRPRPLSRRSTPTDRASGLVNGSARLLERNRGRATPRGNTSQTRSDLKRRGPNPAPAILIGGGVRFSFPSPALSERCHRSLVRCRVSRGDYPVLKVPGAPILVPLAEFFSTFSTAWAPLSIGTGPRRWRRPQLGQSPSQLPSLSQLTVQVCPSPQLFEH